MEAFLHNLFELYGTYLYILLGVFVFLFLATIIAHVINEIGEE